MRKRYRVLLLAFIAAACVVPVGFALSVESESDLASAPPVVVAPRTIQVSRAEAAPVKTAQQPEIPERARLVLVGGAFFGLAAVVRRVA
jgi:hypothetical protein